MRRVMDIVAELEEQEPPIRREAVVARKYLDLQVSRNRWERELLLYELTLALRQEQSLHNQCEKIRDELLSMENAQIIEGVRKTELAVEEAKLLDEINHCDQRIFQLGLLIQQNSEATAQNLADNSSTQAKLSESKDLLDSLSNELSGVEQVLTNHLADVSSYKKRAIDLNDELELVLSSPSSGEEELLNGTVEELEKVERELLSNENSLSLEKKRLELVDNEFRRVEAMLSAFNQQHIAKAEANDVYAQKHAKLKSSLENIQNSLEITIRSEKGSLQSKYGLEAKIKEVYNSMAQAQVHLKAISASENQHEGLSRGARHILNSQMAGVLGAIGTLITMPQKYEVAVEVSLGGSISDIVTDTEVTARKAISVLKDKGLGRATFYPLDLVRPRLPKDCTSIVHAFRGRVCSAIDVVKYDLSLARVMQQLLGNILIADTLDVAIEIAKTSGSTFRIVTLEGDVVAPSGSITGGSRTEKGSWLLSRRREVEETKAGILEMQAQLSSLEESNGILGKTLSDLQRQKSALENELRSLEREMSTNKEDVAVLERE
ncbi:MAG: hypothetical protein Q8N36_02885, partial [bacterium]|nr:hypothetical protein [bacterium]